MAGLKQAFRINRLLEIVKEHKKVQADLSTCEERNSSSSSSPDSKPVVLCSEHAKKEVELYCQTCEEPICLKCAVKGGKHHSHDYKELNDAFEQR